MFNLYGNGRFLVWGWPEPLPKFQHDGLALPCQWPHDWNRPNALQPATASSEHPGNFRYFITVTINFPICQEMHMFHPEHEQGVSARNHLRVCANDVKNYGNA